MIKILLIIGVVVAILVPLLYLLRTLQVPSKIRRAEEFIELGEFAKASEIIKKNSR